MLAHSKGQWVKAVLLMIYAELCAYERSCTRVRFIEIHTYNLQVDDMEKGGKGIGGCLWIIRSLLCGTIYAVITH